ncbi:MAG: hypothetical protein H7288_15085 [Kineosporiaceae bacterium]|nr:hypothetical protein [Aeromicrobium sp.]
MKRQRQGPRFWLGVGVTCAWAVVLVLLVIRAFNSGSGGLAVSALIAAILFTATLLFVFGFLNAHRLARVQQAFPSAVVVPVVVAPLLADQLRALMTALGLARSRVKPTTYATLVADGVTVRVLTDATGIPAASFPSDRVRSVVLGSALVGMRTMTAIAIEVATFEGAVLLPVTPMRTRGNWLRAVPDAEIARLAEDLRSAIGCPAESGQSGT